ncbi:L,D-transpeptidase family protein [Parageobacillus toebii]|jgi:L,D-transpeptidase ErfK/SrfK|uniref:L,D-transpeptidase family protein n=1 Tax=Parageobacillus toebii TaxID=153151 RepID=UPI0019677531|nr:L,D-transpeptidase family protein [Parageobacillus toebii]MED4971106.1 L,D-transpeptidase family protein [Parageobacillus toebii]QSB47960.1 L,D-transpeptidase family protein [Parageobacillus toebii]
MYKHIVKRGETISSIAMDYRTSVQALLSANRLTISSILVPGQAIIIPHLPAKGSIPYTIHISVSRRQLTLKRKGSIVRTYPIGVGKMVTATPVGDFVIVNRQPNPGGPFGAMWLSLSKIHYGIHGTNNPSSIGKYVSKGCIRMHNKDVLQLASMAPNGTEVFIRP